MKKFPKEIYLQRQEIDTGDEYFAIGEDLFDLDEGGKDGGAVAVYVLKETKKLRVLRELV
jgi:hypothetical protein